MHLAGILAGEAQDFLLQGLGITHGVRERCEGSGRRRLVIEIGAAILVEFLILRPQPATGPSLDQPADVPSRWDH